MTISPALDLRAAYEHAEAARIAVAAELASVHQSLRRERTLRAHPTLNEELLEFIQGDSDDTYAVRASEFVGALTRLRDAP